MIFFVSNSTWDVDKDLKAPHEAGREKSGNILSYIQITGEPDR